MALFVSIISAIFIVIGIVVVIFRKRFIFLEEFGKNTGTALGLAFITFGIAIFLLINGNLL